ncbi:hypothetical protein ABIE50_004945 [Chitinophaga sp. OAE865]
MVVNFLVNYSNITNLSQIPPNIDSISIHADFNYEVSYG